MPGAGTPATPRSPGLGVVVVAFGPVGPLRRCLEHLMPADAVVIDNGGSDECRDVTLAHGAHYVRSPSNRGFAAGVNAGVAHLPGTVDILLVNPDAVLANGAADRLHEVLRSDPRLAAVAPRLRRSDGTEEQVRWPLPSPAATLWDAVGRSGAWLAAHPDRAFVTGAVLLIRRAAWVEVGPFDERYFLYGEEADWQRRALDSGWTVRVVDDVVATHEGGGSSSGPQARAALVTDAALTYTRKWEGPAGRLLFRGAALAASARRYAASPARGRVHERARLAVLLGRSPQWRPR